MFDEVKVGFGRYLRGYHDTLAPTTKAMREYVDRAYARCVFWGPGYQIDSVDELLKKYRANDNADPAAPGTSANLPVVIVTMSRDMLPALEWSSRGAPGPVYVIVPSDPKGRVFQLNIAQLECRTQALFIGADEPTARSLAVQFALWISRLENRGFDAPYRWGGINFAFRNQIETPDILINHAQTEQSNLCCMTADLNLRVSVPFLKGPAAGEPNDGKGTDGDPNDPHGYGVVHAVSVHEDFMPSFTLIEQDQPGDPIEVTRSPTSL